MTNGAKIRWCLFEAQKPLTSKEVSDLTGLPMKNVVPVLSMMSKQDSRVKLSGQIIETKGRPKNQYVWIEQTWEQSDMTQ